MTLIRKPEWSFYLTWIAMTALCIPIAFILSTIIDSIIARFVGGFIYVDGVRHTTQDYIGMFTFIPLVGLLTGSLQYGLLCRYLPRMGWWVLATTGGWLLGALISSWLNFWPVDMDLAFIVMGFSIGVGQWLLLRRRLPRAGWWVGASVLGWGFFGLLTGEPLHQLSLLALGLMPTCVTAVTLALLINRALPTELQGSG